MESHLQSRCASVGFYREGGCGACIQWWRGTRHRKLWGRGPTPPRFSLPFSLFLSQTDPSSHSFSRASAPCHFTHQRRRTSTTRATQSTSRRIALPSSSSSASTSGACCLAQHTQHQRACTWSGTWSGTCVHPPGRWRGCRNRL
jgi:hypothetical protein